MTNNDQQVKQNKKRGLMMPREPWQVLPLVIFIASCWCICPCSTEITKIESASLAGEIPRNDRYRDNYGSKAVHELSATQPSEEASLTVRREKHYHLSYSVHQPETHHSNFEERTPRFLHPVSRLRFRNSIIVTNKLLEDHDHRMHERLTNSHSKLSDELRENIESHLPDKTRADSSTNLDFRKTKAFVEYLKSRRWKLSRDRRSDISKPNEEKSERLDLEEYFQFANLQPQLRKELLKIFEKDERKSYSTLDILRKLQNDRDTTLFNVWKTDSLRKSMDGRINIFNDNELLRKSWQAFIGRRNNPNMNNLFKTSSRIQKLAHGNKRLLENQNKQGVKKEIIEGQGIRLNKNSKLSFIEGPEGSRSHFPAEFLSKFQSQLLEIPVYQMKI